MSISLEKEIDRMLTLLRNKIRERGYTQLEVQDKLGWGRSYISQLLTKQKSLRVDQVLLILETIDVDPKDFYAELYVLPASMSRYHGLDSYPDDPLDDMSLGAEPFGAAALGPFPNNDVLHRFYELRALVQTLIQVLIDKNVISPDEVIDAARANDTESD